jgi:hypothetical protein
MAKNNKPRTAKGIKKFTYLARYPKKTSKKKLARKMMGSRLNHLSEALSNLATKDQISGSSKIKNEIPTVVIMFINELSSNPYLAAQ